MLQVVETSGTFTLDVGWYPSGSPEGKFICRTVLSSNWEDPVEELETRRPHVVMQWLQSWVDEIQARLGEHAEISEQAIATVLVPLAMDSQTPITGDAQRVSRVPRLTSSSAAFQSSDAAR